MFCVAKVFMQGARSWRKVVSFTSMTLILIKKGITYSREDVISEVLTVPWTAFFPLSPTWVSSQWTSETLQCILRVLKRLELILWYIVDRQGSYSIIFIVLPYLFIFIWWDKKKEAVLCPIWEKVTKPKVVFYVFADSFGPRVWRNGFAPNEKRKFFTAPLALLASFLPSYVLDILL